MTEKETIQQKYDRLREKHNDELGRVFEQTALQAGMVPLVVNRFQILETGEPDRRVLVVGGGAIAMTKDEDIAFHTRAAGAFLFHRNFATDLVAHLIEHFGIDEAAINEKRETVRKARGVWDE